MHDTSKILQALGSTTTMVRPREREVEAPRMNPAVMDVKFVDYAEKARHIKEHTRH